MIKYYKVNFDIEVDDSDYPIPADGDWEEQLLEDIKEALEISISVGIGDITITEKKGY